MRTSAELQLRKIALFLTAILALQVLWSGVRLWLLSEPEPIVPAPASLQVDDIIFETGQNGELAQDLVARPVFWQGRQAYTPKEPSDEVEPPEKPQRNTNIDKVALQGTYAAGAVSGVIVSYKDERRRLRLDESIAGWTFKMLSGTSAIFENGGESKALPLEHALSHAVPKAKSEKSPKPDETKKQDKKGQ